MVGTDDTIRRVVEVLTSFTMPHQGTDSMASPAADSESPKPLPNEPAPAKTGGVEKLVLRPRSAPAATGTATAPSGSAVPAASEPAKPAAKGAANGFGLNDLRKVGRYTIIKKIGQGGMGAVFLANDTQLKRHVALKVLPKEKAENPILVKRFKAEAQAAAALKHDHIVGIHDAGEADGLLYIALEFIDGTDAHSILAKRGPMPVKRAMEIIRQMTLALKHAHEQKIVHRDIKPSNVLIRKDGVAKLTDMGLARSVDESVETDITRAGTTVGTVDYMAPEQARSSKAADIRSDLYSLGATWFHLLAGHAPFHEGSMLNKLNAHSSKPRPDVRDVNESATEEMAVIIKRMMAIKPEDRYQTPQELLDDLDNENLSRGPVSIHDLAALAQADNDDDDRHGRLRNEPKSSYKKPAAQESKQLMAPTMELPTLPTKSNVSAIPKPAIDADTMKKLIVGAVVVVALGISGVVISKLSSSVSGPVSPGGNPFDREAVATNDAPPSETLKSDGTKPGPKPITPGGKGPKPLTSKSNGNSTANDGNARPAAPTGSLYLPPIGPLGRTGEVKHVPEWITESGSEMPAGLKTVSVGGGPSGFEQVATLRTALERLPEAGGIVELATDGPYFLNPMELVNRATIVIRAANGAKPLVVLVAEPDLAYDSLLQLTNGALTLQDLHVVALARQFANENPLQMVSVRSGDLAIVRCVFTLLGTRKGKTFAFGAEGKVTRTDPNIPASSRLFVRESIVRGASLGGFSIDQTATDLVASRCLFATGTAPVLTLNNHEPADDESGKSSTSPGGTSKSTASKSPGVRTPATKPTKSVSTSARSLRFLSCGIVSSGTAFELSPGVNAATPPATEITVVNCAAAGVTAPQSAAVFLALPRWPQALLNAESQSPYPRLKWTVETSVVCGWKKLVQDEPGTSAAVLNGAAWKDLWRNQPGLDESQFVASGWPKSAPRDFAAVTTAELGLPEELGIKGSDSLPPGCLLEGLSEPTALAMARVTALADRARYSITGLEQFAPNKTLHIDGSTQDIGKILNTENWPSGTLAIVTGTGQAGMTPIEIKGKSLRIEFESSGAPLIISPRKSSRPKDEALFVLEGGSLEIVGGHFRFPNSSSESLPQFFLSVHDGNFALRQCEVIGQTLDSTSQFSGLIHWKRAQAERKDLNVPNERNSGVIVDSALLTSGRLLDADLRNRTLILRNSLFASIGEMFDLNIQGFSGHIGATVDARWCTFGAGGKYLFQVRGTKGAEKTSHPMHMFLENSAMLSLTELSGATATPVLLSVQDHVLTNQQMTLWDVSNGYAAPWPQLIRAAETPAKPAQSFDADWKNRWGAERVIRPLTEAGGVRWATPLPHRTKITPRDFVLAPNSTAATWSSNGTPIGTAIYRTGDAPKTAPPAASPKTPGSATKKLDF